MISCICGKRFQGKINTVNKVFDLHKKKLKRENHTHQQSFNSNNCHANQQIYSQSTNPTAVLIQKSVSTTNTNTTTQQNAVHHQPGSRNNNQSTTINVGRQSGLKRNSKDINFQSNPNIGLQAQQMPIQTLLPQGMFNVQAAFPHQHNNNSNNNNNSGQGNIIIKNQTPQNSSHYNPQIITTTNPNTNHNSSNNHNANHPSFISHGHSIHNHPPKTHKTKN